MEEVRFMVEGTELCADLYLPPDLKPGERRPALVCGHGFSFIKEGLVTQGEFFSKAGYVVLAIDFRSFGRSGGEIRGELFPERQIEDFRSAISYLQTRPDVEPGRIGLWGTSFGGALVLATAARDRRVRAVVAQVPIVHGRRWMQWLRTPEQWEALLDGLEEDRKRRFAGEASARIPVALEFTSKDICAMPADDQTRQYMDILEAETQSWRRDIALESVEKVIEFRPIDCIDQISPTPLCVIMNSGYEVLHPWDQVMEAYATAKEPKELVITPCDQLGLYVEPGLSEALNAALLFLEKHLPVGRNVGGRPQRTLMEIPSGA